MEQPINNPFADLQYPGPRNKYMVSDCVYEASASVRKWALVAIVVGALLLSGGVLAGYLLDAEWGVLMSIPGGALLGTGLMLALFSARWFIRRAWRFADER